MTDSETSTRTFRSATPATAFITSARIMTRGPHDIVHIWVRGAQSGTFIVDAGDGELIVEQLGLLTQSKDLNR